MTTKRPDVPEVSAKSKKEDILSAYHEMVERLQEKVTPDPQEEKKRSDEVAVVNKASQQSVDQIVSSLANVKISLNKQIDGLSGVLIGEFEKLTDLKQAIAHEQKHLQELYNIKETVHTLTAITLAQREQTEAFELKMSQQRLALDQELTSKKAEWEKQQAILEAEFAERKEKLAKQHQRDEEDYAYNLEIQRRNDMQDYALKKAELEKELDNKRQELNQKEAHMNARLQEFERLKQQVEQFPAELTKATEKTAQEITEKLNAQYHFTTALKEKEIDGERKLQEQKIASLENRIKELELHITKLTHKADEAASQVQEIACRALDASSQRLSFSHYADKQNVNQDRVDKKVA
jgi:hypothetical protein